MHEEKIINTVPNCKPSAAEKEHIDNENMTETAITRNHCVYLDPVDCVIGEGSPNSCKIHFNKQNVVKWILPPLQVLCSGVIVQRLLQRLRFEDLAKLIPPNLGVLTLLLKSALVKHHVKETEILLKMWPWEDMSLAPLRLLLYVSHKDEVQLTSFLLSTFLTLICTGKTNYLRSLNLEASSIRHTLFLNVLNFVKQYSIDNGALQDDKTVVHYNIKLKYQIELSKVTPEQRDILLNPPVLYLRSKTVIHFEVKAIYADTWMAEHVATFFSSCPREISSLTVNAPYLRTYNSLSQIVHFKLLQELGLSVAIAGANSHGNMQKHLAESVSKFMHLMALDLTGIDLGNMLSSILDNTHKGLERLKLGACNLQKGDLRSLCHSSHVKTLQELDVSKNSFKTCGKEFLDLVGALSPCLHILNLSFCDLPRNISIPLVLLLSTCKNLAFVDMMFNSFCLEDICGDIIKLAGLEAMFMVKLTYGESDASYLESLGWSDLQNELEKSMNEYRVAKNPSGIHYRVHVCIKWGHTITE